MSARSPRGGDMDFLKTILESPAETPYKENEGTGQKDENVQLQRYGSFGNLNDYIDGVDELHVDSGDSVDETDEYCRDGRTSRLSAYHREQRHNNHHVHRHRHESGRHRRHKGHDKQKTSYKEDVLDCLGNKLEQKYSELQNLLAQQFVAESSTFVKRQVDEAKRLVKKYSLASHGLPTTPPVTLSYVPHPVSPRSDNGTQTEEIEILDGDYNGTPRSLKRVSFAPHELSECADDDLSLSSRSDYSSYKGILKKSRETFHGKKLVSKVKREQEQRPVLRSASESDVQPKRNVTVHEKKKIGRASEMSRGSSPEPSQRRDDRHCQKTDTNLKDTNDPMILGWIHRKNIERKKKKVEKREKRKIKRQQKLEETVHQEKRKEEAAVAMDNWLKEKRKQVLLLKKRAKTTQSMIHPSHDQGLNPEIESNDPNDSSMKAADSKTHHGDNSAGLSPRGRREKDGDNKAKTVSPKRKCDYNRCDEALKCTCGYLEAKATRDQDARSERRSRSTSPTKTSRDSKTPWQPTKLDKPRTTSESLDRNHKRPSSTPPSTKGEQTQTEKEKETRMSYDEWLTKKRQQDKENREKLEKEKQERLNNSDPDSARIIPDMAKKRIDNIMSGKKKIDTGLNNVDEAANAYPSRPASAPPTRHASATNKSNKYKWVEHSDDSVDEGESRNKPPSAKQPTKQRPHTAKLRPSSAKQNYSRPTPPRSASSPTPRSQIENISHTSGNPFKIPFPPGPKKPSRLHEQGFRGRKFATYIWDSVQDEERPEPQGCDNPDRIPSHDINDNVPKTTRSPENVSKSRSDTGRSVHKSMSDEKALVPKIRTTDAPSEGAFMTSLDAD